MCTDLWNAQILPTRVRSIEEWMRKVDYKGAVKDVLKDHKDMKDTSGKSAPGGQRSQA
jgi:hypothetical protein